METTTPKWLNSPVYPNPDARRISELFASVVGNLFMPKEGGELPVGVGITDGTEAGLTSTKHCERCHG